MKEKKRTTQDVIEHIKGHLYMNFLAEMEYSYSCPMISIKYDETRDRCNIDTYVTFPNYDGGRIVHINHSLKMDEFLKKYDNDNFSQNCELLSKIFYDDILETVNV